jgi:hypothetical protein
MKVNAAIILSENATQSLKYALIISRALFMKVASQPLPGDLLDFVQ